MDSISSWPRNVRSLTLLYLVAGVSFVPWGVAYASLRGHGGWSDLLITLASLGCGLLTAHVAWQTVNRLLPKSASSPILASPQLIRALTNSQAYQQTWPPMGWGLLPVPQTQTGPQPQAGDVGLSMLVRKQHHQVPVTGLAQAC